MKTSLLLVPLSTLALLAGCAKHSTPGEAAASLPPATVRIATVQAETAPVITGVTGTIRPAQRATIAAKVMGTIQDLPVTLGQHVRAGDILARIAADEISTRVLQAQSQLNQARRDLDRERDLLAKGASTADMVKGLEDRFAMTQAMVREAEVMLGYTMIRAPFDGVVARKFAHAGDLAAPGMPLLEVEGTDAFQVEAGIPDSLVSGLSVGTTITVEVPAANATFSGNLAEVSSAADASARTVAVKIAVPAGTAVRSGQFARLQVPGESVRALLAPAAAVTSYGQMQRVFIAAGDRAELRLIKTGAAHGDRIEILAGLAEGERVVVSPPTGLREGQPLEVRP
ncbi:MAG: efflux RND transporter periplasmic adaptor subunit [Opitutaceae bacterium]|nr:efflux RND transporter periplasmic adaptor subunit [Opitutaceae bacterium]